MLCFEAAQLINIVKDKSHSFAAKRAVSHWQSIPFCLNFLIAGLLQELNVCDEGQFLQHQLVINKFINEKGFSKIHDLTKTWSRIRKTFTGYGI